MTRTVSNGSDIVGFSTASANRSTDVGTENHPSETKDGLEGFRAKVNSDPLALAAYHDAVRRRTLQAGLKRFRKLAGLSQKTMAAVMGTTQSGISAMESGKSDPQLTTLQRFARSSNHRLDFAVVDASYPVFDEEMASELWRQVETNLLSPLLTKIATGQRNQRTLAALAKDVNFSDRIVGPILDSLETRGWVTTKAGEEQPFYVLGDRAAYVIGISIERDRVVGALVDMHTHLVGDIRTSSLTETDSHAVVGAVVDVAAALYRARGDHSILGIGVSIAGIVAGETGSVHFAPDLQSDNANWDNVPLETLVQEKLQLRVSDLRVKVAVANDANSLAMLTHLRESPQSVAAVMMSGAGIGFGLVNQGHTIHGFHGAAGESGHVIVDPNGEMCRASLPHLGCLETAASAQAVLNKLDRSVSSTQELEAGLAILNHRIEQLDVEATDALIEAGEMFGRFLATAMTLTDPERLVLFAHPELANTEKYLSAEVFQAAVESGVDASKGLISPPKRVWLSITPEISAAAAGAATMRHFLSDPAYWQPDVLTPEPARNPSLPVPLSLEKAQSNEVELV